MDETREVVPDGWWAPWAKRGKIFFWDISIHMSEVLRLDQAHENMDFEQFVALKFEES